MVKTRSHCVHSELLSVLLALPIKNVNLDKEKEDIIKSKKFMTRKQKLLAMSKKERKVRTDNLNFRRRHCEYLSYFFIFSEVKC